LRLAWIFARALHVLENRRRGYGQPHLRGAAELLACLEFLTLAAYGKPE
jgi:hypothetical protein